MKFIVLFLILNAYQELGFYISVEVKDVKGQIFVAVYDNENNYMQVNEALYSKSMSVTQPIESIFIPLNDGKYSITIFHDLDGSQSLTKNFLGIPKEPYGFSNNVQGFAGPPDFSDALIETKVGERYRIMLR